ncbi:hypothetical protein VPNG_08666 [Cytospora leucostoma]|uniref:Uncharacterized protein n=1 Tax=Cytospora leucostoma TaxID=1230097 RepID=A0A423W3A3_9PEZI|nr:hypothetical protein VPNG_08666 [Cytospora leucostoma]
MPVDSIGLVRPSGEGTVMLPKAEKRADLPESAPEGVRTEQGITGFMVRVSSRLRHIQPAHKRVEARHRFLGLLTSVNLNLDMQSPYDLAAADTLRDFLQEVGLTSRILLDFELILKAAESEAQARWVKAEKVAEALEATREKRGEWDVIEQSDVDEQWEIV